jgi:CheY-like chemotaxis protein
LGPSGIAASPLRTLRIEESAGRVKDRTMSTCAIADGPSVLVIEDEDDTRELFCEAIQESIGCRAYAARDGREAMETLQSLDKRPCLILLDWAMPRVSGSDVLRWLKQDEALASIPVAVMSGMAKIDAPGVSHILLKPIMLDVLLGLVRQHCGGERAWPVARAG